MDPTSVVNGENWDNFALMSLDFCSAQALK
jgi:hypothetical protein